MLLCIDVGNTNIVIGIYQGQELKTHWRISTDQARMPDEYGLMLSALLQSADIKMEDIKGVAIASVVPPITDTITEMLERYFTIPPVIVGTGVKTGVALRIDNPREVGADRVVDTVAAYRLYGGPACVVDFGTATTFDAVSANGEYLGGAIAPGVRLAADALFRGTAKLPRVDLQRPAHAVGTNTVDSMRSGILLGYVGLVEGMVARFRDELGPGMHVIATGGLADVIARETKGIDVVDPWLTLKGLRMVYEMNRGGI
ncbi:MAG: type III pantothenate kinase [Anaerolineae bacterium]